MNLVETVASILEHEEPRAAFRALSGSLASLVPLRQVAWVAPGGVVAAVWPEGAECGELADRVHGGAPVRVALGDGSDLLLLPLSPEDGVLAVIGAGPVLGAELGPWTRVARAFALVAGRARRAEALEQERAALRQRAEESEALHVLGLAANRSLDPDEVLDLVARFARTLLGAHYVTVSTLQEDRVHTLAAVGLRLETDARGSDPLAAEVVQQGAPITLGEDAVNSPRYAFHRAQEVRVALGVPLALFGNTFGALVVGYRRPYAVTSRDIRLALTLAGHAAVAISNARLHRAIADRSRELERAYEELRWSSQAKERFFASMSHELRTPLNAILGYQSLLLEGIAGELPERAQQYVESANRATRALLLLVNDVLDLAKIEAGKVELHFRPTSVFAVLQEALSTMRPLAEAKGIQLLLPPESDLPLIDTDSDRVGQILLNLLGNAVKFTEQGSVSLAVELEVGERSRAIAIRVTDTGPGIAPENRERIFHEFEQVTGATARGGTGLGLPISRKLARLLGGDLTVESEVGHGSTFVLRLPVGEAPVGTSLAEQLITDRT